MNVETDPSSSSQYIQSLTTLNVDEILGVKDASKPEISTREAFGKALRYFGEKDPNIVVLDADLSKSTHTAHFAMTYPERFFNVGIAEQDMVSVAAGLASCGKIVVVSRDTSSGTYEVWEKKVMKKERVYPGALLQASNGAIVQIIGKNKNAIGYIGIGYMNNTVKPLTVENVTGTVKTTLSGEFLISRPLYMFTNKWPAGEISKFINYALHPEKGQKLVEEAGFVPLY